MGENEKMRTRAAVVHRAAGIAAPVFRREGWQWFDNPEPDRYDIERTIDWLLDYLGGDNRVIRTASGRFMVEQDISEGGDLLGYNIYLSLGSFDAFMEDEND